MKLRALPVVGVTVGLVTAGFLVSGPARAQFAGPPSLQLPAQSPVSLVPNTAQVSMPQPIEVQALDSSHFVVVTREPRLVIPAGREGGTATNMIVPVVTHYTVAGNRLVPVEHVRAPSGWQPVPVSGE